MKKFNEWVKTRSIVNESLPNLDSIGYGRFLGNIMGWDSHGDPKTFKGRITNWMAGGKHRKAQEMGADLYKTIADPRHITDIINQAKIDGVYATSTYNACYEMVKKIGEEYNPSPNLNNPKFQSELLHGILGKCHKEMDLDYVAAENFYHDVMGTEPGVKRELALAYNKSPKDLKDWLAIADGTHKPHPAYDPDNHSTQYWLIEAHNLISPYNLIKKLIMSAPHRTLTLPSNAQELYNMSVEFGKAYFPNLINERLSNTGSTGSKTKDYGNELDDLISAIKHFEGNLKDVDLSGGDNSIKTDGKKASLIQALSVILGPKAAADAGANADTGSIMATLIDHTNFFGMQQILEQSKHGTLDNSIRD